MTVAEDGSEALLSIVVLDATGNCPNRFIRCMGLTPGASYRDEASGLVYDANALMAQGLPMPTIPHPRWPIQMVPCEYDAFQIHLRKL